MEQKKILSFRVILITIIFIFLIPMSPMFISWQWDWWQAWFYFLVNSVGFIISRVIANRRHPDLIVERSKYLDQPDAEPWDKVLSALLGLSGALIPIVAGLDARFGSQLELGLPRMILAVIFILLGYALGSYALIENRFFQAWYAFNRSVNSMSFVLAPTDGCAILVIQGLC